MRETALEEMFAEFEADAMTVFRPPGVPAAQRRTRVRRRRRRGVLAGVAALLLAGPAGAFAVADRGDRRDPKPTPTVAPSPSTRLTERTVTLPGVRGDLTELRFVDSRTGWALFDTCESHDPTASRCVRTVGRTTDGGATWRRVALPTAPNGPAYLLPRDDRTLTVVAGDRYLVTTDGGASFTSHPVDSPPEATRRTMATPSGLVIKCPSANGVRDGAAGVGCDREQVFRVGGGPLRQQPPVALRADVEHTLVEGGDGRLWLTVTDGDRLTVVTSGDLGLTWQKLAVPRDARQLTVSPDGSEVWLVTADAPRSVWRLVGNRWEERPGLPDDTAAAVAAGGGIMVVVSHYGGAGFWVDGRYVDIPQLRDPLRSDSDAEAGVEVLSDGAVLFSYGRTRIVGVGRGVDRTWTWIR